MKKYTGRFLVTFEMKGEAAEGRGGGCLGTEKRQKSFKKILHRVICFVFIY